MRCSVDCRSKLGRFLRPVTQGGIFNGENRQVGSAFTRPEVLVAVVVLTIVALGYYGGLSTGFVVLQSTRENLRATQIMMQKAEAIRLCTWSQLNNVSFTEDYNPLSGSTNSSGV